MVMNNKYDIPSNLIGAFLDREVTLFIGAGVSCQAGLPSWKTTIDKMKSMLISEAKKNRGVTQERLFLRDANYLEIVERFKTVLSKEEYYTFLYSQFYSKDYHPSEVHKKLAKLPVKYLITTNFDVLMETALQEEYGYPPLKCTNYRQVVQACSQQNRYIIKLHGCITDLDTIIFSESDYRNFTINQKPLLDFIRSQLDTSIILFIGYSMNDPDFNSILDKSLAYSDGSKRDDYAIFKGMNQINKNIWKNKGIKIINIENFNELGDLLDQLLFLIENPQMIDSNNYTEHPLLKKQLISNSKDKYQTCSIFGLKQFRNIDQCFVERILRGVTDFSIPSDINVFFNRTQRILINGEPGSGKSYLVDFLAYFLTHFTNIFDVVIKIPLIELKVDSNEYSDLWSAIIRYVSNDLAISYLSVSNFKALLKNNRVLLLLDGLDEVDFQYRKYILRTFNNLLREFSKLSITVTTRKVDSLNWRGFEQFVLTGLSYEDSKELIDCWFKSYSRNIDLTLSNKAKNIIKMNPCFCENALLTAAVCRVVVESSEIILSRTNIFKRIIKWMFENYRSSNSEIINQLKLALSFIAMNMWKCNQSHRISKDELVSKLTLCLINTNIKLTIKEIIRIYVDEIGILRRSAENSYAFINRSIFEYFVAKGFLKNEDLNDILIRYCNEGSFENISRFIIGLVDCKQQEQFMKSMWNKNAQLALKCITECGNIKVILPGLHTLDDEEELVVLVKSLPMRLSPIELVETLESLFIRQYRNPYVLYFAVNILENIISNSTNEYASDMAKGILNGFWSEKNQYDIMPNLIKIEGGNYSIGDDLGVDLDERPRHSIYLSSYQIGETLVTNREYLEFCPTYQIDRHSNSMEMPVTNITWYEAALYCRWRLGSKGRLPTEAEWEVASERQGK